MKTLLLIFSLFCVNLYAPPSSQLPTKEQSYQFTILTNPQFRIYYPLIKAIVYVESRGDDSAFNESEGAKGRYQILKVRIDHFNQLTGKNYEHDEMFDRYKSTEVFMYFTQGRDYETIARAWNGGEAGRKAATDNYWMKVSNQLSQL